MTCNILHSLVEELKLIHSDQNTDVANCGLGYGAEIRKWTEWINSRNIEPLERRRCKVRDLVKTIPPGSDWHVITGFDASSSCPTGVQQRLERGAASTESTITIDNQLQSGDTVQRNDTFSEPLAQKSNSRRADIAASSVTSSPLAPSISTATEPALTETMEENSSAAEEMWGLKQLIEEQKKLQAALRRDMKSQEELFREQYSKLAEQQRRLTERDALRELLQQQQHTQQHLLMQHMMSAQVPQQAVAPGFLPSHMLSIPHTLQSMSPGSSFSLSTAQPPPIPAFHNPPSMHQPIVVPQYQSASHPVPPFPSSGMSFPNPTSDHQQHGHGDMPTSSSHWNVANAEHEHRKFENSAEVANTRHGDVVSEERVASAGDPRPSQPPLSKMQQLLAAQLHMSDASDDEQHLPRHSSLGATVADSSKATTSSHFGGVGSSWMSEGDPIVYAASMDEWAATINNPSNAWRWEIMVAIMKGWLVRRLMRTEKVQVLITTIRDARDFLANLRYAEEEFPGMTDAKDAQLQQRVISQLRAAIFDLHHVFFELPMRAKLDLIAASRKHLMNKRLHGNLSAAGAATGVHSSRDMNISSATLKARQRKQKGEGAPLQLSADSTPREKKTPKRVDCGLRGGYLPKRDPPQPVKLDPRKYYSKHALSRPRSAGGQSARSSSRDSSVTSSVSRTGHEGASTPTPSSAPNTSNTPTSSRGRHEKRRNADMHQK